MTTEGWASKEATYAYESPREHRPIVILGAGGIVRDAHLPAYKAAGFNVWGIANRTVGKAEVLAEEFGISEVFDSTSTAVKSAPEGAIFDLALMPEQYEEVLSLLPLGAGVLIQKPLGYSHSEAKKLTHICQKRNLVAAVNTQLRFAPYVQKAREMLKMGLIGEVFDFQIRVSVNTPWELFPNVFGLERMEIAMHSVHYIDLIRSFFGNPTSVSAVTSGHPEKTDISSTRTLAIFHYQYRNLRVSIDTNHDNSFGSEHHESMIHIQGTKGALRIQMGLLLDYPKGGQDFFEYFSMRAPEKGWQRLPVEGTWFPDAFAGSMGILLRFLEGSVKELPTSVSDVLQTMGIVEAAYSSSERGGINLREILERE